MLPCGCLAETLIVAVPPATATGTTFGPMMSPFHAAESPQPPLSELNGPKMVLADAVPLTFTVLVAEQAAAPAGDTPMPVITGTVQAPATTAAAVPPFRSASRRL